jgi:hypothetical protein
MTDEKLYAEFKDNLLQKVYILRSTIMFISSNKFSEDQLSAEECTVLCNFSENFTFVMQDEIQSYHWVNSQATLHHFVIYFKDSSDSLQHKKSLYNQQLNGTNTETAYIFQKKVLENTKQHLPNLKKVIHFTDGAARQYKNKKKISNLACHKEDINLEAKWHFFATSH